MRRIGIGLFTLVTAWASGCVITKQVYEKGGKRYGVIQGAFRGRWYNYYERAQSFSEGGFYKEAIGDLREAIALRPKDTRRARTGRGNGADGRGRVARRGSAVSVFSASASVAELVASDSRQMVSFKMIEMTSSKGPNFACQSNSTVGCEDTGEGLNS